MNSHSQIVAIPIGTRRIDERVGDMQREERAKYQRGAELQLRRPVLHSARNPTSGSGCRLLCLRGCNLQVRDDVSSILRGFKAREDHLGLGDEPAGVLEVIEQSLLLPHDASGLVGGSVAIALRCARLAAKETIQVGTQLMTAALPSKVQQQKITQQPRSRPGKIDIKRRHTFPAVWHWLQRALKSFSPFAALPVTPWIVTPAGGAGAGSAIAYRGLRRTEKGERRSTKKSLLTKET
jgi:hypothetical protein